ncbi:MAG: glutaredoxin 3 [Myxococcales bacterium]|nr:glutaredoxin 3 [Myxococcales bacterium]
MAQVQIYTTRICAYCVMAKRLLARLDQEYEEIGVDADHEKRAWLVEATGQRTVPQIFIDGQSIGGYQELAALHQKGELEELLS